MMTVAADAPRAEPAESDNDWVAGAIATLRARWWLVALVTLAALVIAIVYLRTADYRYTASLTVAPAPSTTREAPGLGNLGGLASLTGITIEAIPATPFRLYVEGFSSREVAVRLAADPALMHQVFAREWDARNRRWSEPASIASDVQRAVAALAGAPVPRWRPPDAVRLQEFLNERIAVDQNPKTPLVTVYVQTEDRSLGPKLLARLHAVLDGWLREKTLARTAENIAYINRHLPTVLQADHREALFATLSDQEQRAMMARNPAAFAAEPFGDITVSPIPTSPRQIPVLATALALGLIFGLVVALVVPRRRA